MYAKNFASGNGLVFNIGERVEGFTSFLWIFILTISYWLKIYPEIYIKVLSISFGVGCLILTYFLTDIMIRKKQPKIQINSYFCFIPVLLLVISSTFYYWAVSGMETTLYTFLCLLGIYYFLIRNEKTIYLYLSMIFLSLAFLTRQEAVLIICIFILNLLIEQLKENNYKVNIRAMFKPNLVMALSIFIIPAVILLSFRLFYYGYLFPNTFYAKTGISTDYIKTGIQYTFSFIKGYLLYGTLLILPATLFLEKELRKRILLFYTIIIFYIIYIILVGGDVLVMHRFFIPVLPLIFIIFTVFIVYIYKITQNIIKNNFLRNVIFMLFIIFVGLYIHMNNFQDSIRMSRKEKGLTSSMKNVALAFKEKKEKENKHLLVVTSTVGALKYFSDCNVLDMLGLTDKFIAHNPSPIKLISDYNTGWKEKNYNSKYILSQKPDYIIFSTREKPSSFAERALFTQANFLKKYFIYPIFIETSEVPYNVYKRRSIDKISLRSKLVQMNRNYSPSFINLYNLFLNQISNRLYLDNIDSVKKTFNELIKICPSYFAEPFRFMALVYYYKSDYKKAIDLSNECLKIDPSNLYARIILYRISRTNGLEEDAKKQENYFLNNFPEIYSKKKFMNKVAL